MDQRSLKAPFYIGSDKIYFRLFDHVASDCRNILYAFSKKQRYFLENQGLQSQSTIYSALVVTFERTNCMRSFL